MKLKMHWCKYSGQTKALDGTISRKRGMEHKPIFKEELRNGN